MKKILILFGLLLCFIFAQAQTRPSIYTESGKYVVFGGTSADTIYLGSTLIYNIYVEHLEQVQPYIHYYLAKLRTNNPTITLTLLQSNDGTNFVSIKRGKNRTTAYSKTLTPTVTDTHYDLSFANDSAVLEGRWLRIQLATTYVTSSLTKIQWKPTFQMKVNVNK
jgi:hypothetical protein